ncbi:hypothetical protein [Myxosarcina sp. GI1]|uniref:hypothetical protein n=1 Tax=Myxosarcina sp. GI1 TaxID=1541065 RepID=UPI00068C68A8|nr:hypothetical protein [Myxosarcina sp. GI1]
MTVAIAAIYRFGNIKRLTSSLAVLIAVTLITYFTSLPALATTNIAALGANDRALTEEQQQFEEDLKLTPDGSHYSGLEHVEQTTAEQMPVDNETIEQSIRDYAGDSVTIGVASGSVRLTGRVKDKDTAHDLVEQTKSIPGVREVTFNIGLDNKAS